MKIHVVYRSICECDYSDWEMIHAFTDPSKAQAMLDSLNDRKEKFKAAFQEFNQKVKEWEIQNPPPLNLPRPKNQRMPIELFRAWSDKQRAYSDSINPMMTYPDQEIVGIWEFSFGILELDLD